MKFRVTNSRLDGSMSCLQGYVTTEYDTLIEIFGNPILGSGDGKVSAEWIIKFSDGEVATIYDYKEPETPIGVYEWHIGGHSRKVVERIIEIVEEHTYA